MDTRFAKKFGVLLTCVAIGFSGCKKNSEKEEVTPEETMQATITVTDTPTPTPSETPVPVTQTVDEHEGEQRSYLTGLWMKKEEAMNRPFAVMINNIVNANPQSGISDASILYEAIVEGGITRLMGIFENVDPESKTAKRIGSVRSARHYYVSFADEYDAIFVHFGQTSYAVKKIKALGIDTISAMDGPGVNSFYRDKSIKAPHNAFISLEGIESAIKKGKYRTTYQEGYEGHFKFYDEDTDLQGEDKASEIILSYSKAITPRLVYDPEKKVYFRYQYNGPHIDANTNEQLSFKNVIVQFVKEWNIDKNGYQTMDIEDASGKGYYITNGIKTDITWKKNESTKKMRYYSADGKELTINPGKTFISIFPNDRVSDVMIHAAK